ncbi:MAG TPA: hypothetical protein VNB49_02475, partial [Candidatus Dormibacteraeota bacterium]|nr:hypothetical protein [Candidatus Dormibacteraeota bacterium]
FDILTGLKADDSYFAQRNALESLRRVPASQSGLTAPGSPQAITACPAARGSCIPIANKKRIPIFALLFAIFALSIPAMNGGAFRAFPVILAK